VGDKVVRKAQFMSCQSGPANTVNMASIPDLESLSCRGKTAAQSPVPVFLDVIGDLFSGESNPTGFVSLGLAENVWIILLHGVLMNHNPD
jgi:hypothetical protein